MTRMLQLPDPPRRASRRSLLRRGLALGAATVVGGGVYAFGIEPRWWEVVSADLPIRGLPPSLVGRTLVQLSDLHIGARCDQGYLCDVLEEVRSWRPDFVVLTGDLVDVRRTGDIEGAAPVLDALPRGRLGTVSILGNHDYGRGWGDERAAAGLQERLEALDTRVLRNDVVDVAGLQIAGMDDLWSGRLRVRETLGKLDPAQASLVLCHNPDGVDLEGWDDYQGWILSGHTHGGQVKPPFLPPPLLPVTNRRYTRGAFDLAGGRRLYINAGVGWLRRVRFNVRPEVTLFTLQAASAAG